MNDLDDILDLDDDDADDDPSADDAPDAPACVRALFATARWDFAAERVTLTDADREEVECYAMDDVLDAIDAALEASSEGYDATTAAESAEWVEWRYGAELTKLGWA